MALRPRHLLIRWILPYTWGSNPAQKMRVLQEFAQTELDSAWQSIYAMERVNDAHLRGLLFQHAFEEMFHSDLFHRLATRKAQATPVVPLTRREPLLELKPGDPRGAVEFFAYLAIGESEIQCDFNAYEMAIDDEEVRQLFMAIRQDEQHHAADSGNALEQLVATQGLSLRWLRLRHLGQLAWRRYVSLGNKFGALPMTAMLALSYYLFGSIFAGQARERMKLSAEKQLELLRRQQFNFDASLGAGS